MTNAQIILMLKENRYAALESIYNKYSGDMFGLICSLTDDKNLAENILVTAFTKLSDKKTLSTFEYLLFLDIMRHTYLQATIALQEKFGPGDLKPSEIGTIMHFLCLKCNSAKDVAYILNIPEFEVRNKLRFESLRLRQLKNL